MVLARGCCLCWVRRSVQARCKWMRIRGRLQGCRIIGCGMLLLDVYTTARRCVRLLRLYTAGCVTLRGVGWVQGRRKHHSKGQGTHVHRLSSWLEMPSAQPFLVTLLPQERAGAKA
jgi:hypothetical protein